MNLSDRDISKINLITKNSNSGGYYKLKAKTYC